MGKEKLKNNKKKKLVREEAPKKEKDIVLIILIVIIIIVTAILIGIKISNLKKIDPNDDRIKELHNYFNTENLLDCNGLLNYSDDKVEYSSLNAENRLCIAYHKSDIKDTESETYKPKKKETTCKVDDMVFRVDEESNNCNVTKIKREVIDSTYKKIFGKEVEENETFRIDSFNVCYLKDDYYYCGLSDTYTYSISSDSKIYRIISKAVQKTDDEIIIYDYFMKVNGDNCYTSYTTNIKDEKCTEGLAKKKIEYKFIKKYAKKYEHTFKKAEDGSYYWVSSKPIK